jgi:hypothetical protein
MQFYFLPPGERSAILLAVALAKTIVAEYDQRKRKFVSLDGSIVTNDIGYRRRE